MVERKLGFAGNLDEIAKSAGFSEADELCLSPARVLKEA